MPDVQQGEAAVRAKGERTPAFAETLAVLPGLWKPGSLSRFWRHAPLGGTLAPRWCSSHEAVAGGPAIQRSNSIQHQVRWEQSHRLSPHGAVRPGHAGAG